MYEVKKIVGDPRDRNIIDIQFVSFDKEKQQVKRSLKLIQFDLVRSCIHDIRIV